MASYVTIHLRNAALETEQQAQAHFARIQSDAATYLRGVQRVESYECEAQQLMPDIAQPWKYLTIYDRELDEPEVDIPALAPLIANYRAEGPTIPDNAERVYTYRMYSDWRLSKNWSPGPFSHMMFLLANFTAGREDEYHQWYDEHHSVEVSNTPGYVGMRRGKLDTVQVPPAIYCPGSELILGGLQSTDLTHSLADFGARAMGTSPSGVAWGPRSSSASRARTVHIFRRVGEPQVLTTGEICL
jgi:hypothetical protein